MQWKIIFLTFISMFFVTQNTQASIIITEILADPPLGIEGDANGDGVRSSSEDEFVEIFNQGDFPVDLEGWILSDSVRNRHTFLQGSILDPMEFLVVFGGGSVSACDIYCQMASSGGLSLNNTGDTVSLLDADGSAMDYLSYGAEANTNQSIVRFPLESEDFILHSQIDSDQDFLYSPGYSLDATSTVPEFASVSYLLFGLIGLLLKW